MDVEKIVREYIDKTIHMSLATCENNKPWVCEVHFAYDGDLNLYFRSLTSRRHSQEIANNPYVAGNIVKQHLPGEVPNAIYFEGEAELIGNEAQRQKVFPYFQSRFNLKDNILEEANQPDGHQFYKIKVKSWYTFGLFDGPKVQKLKLEWDR